MESIPLSDRIGTSGVLIEWLDRQIDGTAFALNDRCRLAGGCLDISMEHHKAIVVLMANRLYGSAMAMVRPTFEAYLRGAWLHQCADDACLESFAKGKLRPMPAAMIEDLERLPSFEGGVLLKAHQASWSKMCDFTHTGVQQTIRRNTQESIESNYDEAELIEALGFADAIGVMCGLEIAHLAGNIDLAQCIFERAQCLFRPPT